MPPVVNCVLPSGRQMRENNVAESVQEEIREIALQVLKKLLAPIIFLKKGKQVRQQLTAQYLSDTTEKEMLTAAERTFHYISFLTHYTPGLAEDVTRVGATGLVKRGVQEDHSTDASVSVDERDRTQEGGDEEEEGERTPTGDSHATLPSGAILSPNARKIAFATKDDTSNASSPKHKRTQLEPHQLNTIKQAIRDMLRTARRTVRVHNECIQWSVEPAHEVTLLLAGSVRRVFPTLGGENPHTIKPSKPPLGAARESPASLNASRRGSTALGFVSAAGSVPVQFNGTGRRVSMALDALLSTARSNSTVASTPGSQGLRRQSMSSAGKLKSTTAVAWSEEEVEAPSVFGEASSIAGFPYCQQLYVSSPTALLLQVPLSAYARLLAVCPVELQRTCMIAAMAWRQHYLPVFAPLTVSRLRMCPLLTSLKKDQLEGVLTHAVPRSFPAGMICNGEAKASLLSSRPSVVGNTPFSFPQSNNASTSALFANHNPNNAKDEEELVPIKIDSQSIFFRSSWCATHAAGGVLARGGGQLPLRQEPADPRRGPHLRRDQQHLWRGHRGVLLCGHTRRPLRSAFPGYYSAHEVVAGGATVGVPRGTGVVQLVRKRATRRRLQLPRHETVISVHCGWCDGPPCAALPVR
ncbi:hypothetical protein AGDE_16438 [Angomonas deanei]|nr:hypothetical protein AGDE_16438 [Angomonas deanei]|eukprot:EPY17075.1 hypothetical protein AGDE_16438 [Angomonas deanei]